MDTDNFLQEVCDNSGVTYNHHSWRNGLNSTAYHHMEIIYSYLNDHYDDQEAKHEMMKEFAHIVFGADHVATTHQKVLQPA